MRALMVLALVGCVAGAPGGKDPEPGDDTGWTGTDATDVVLAGVSGPEGALLWSDAPGSWIVEVSLDGDEPWEELRTGPSPWGLPPQPEGAWFRLRGSDGSASWPAQPPFATASLRLDVPIVGADEPISGLLEVRGNGARATTGSLPGVSVQLSRQGSRTPEQWLDGQCLEQKRAPELCWGPDPAPLLDWRLPELSAATPEPLSWQIRAVLLAEQQGQVVVLARAREDIVATGRRLAYGDLHAHSNLSFDGCEVRDETCSSRASTPAEGFFANTPALGFAALTEHAEHDTLLGLEGVAADIWSAQQEAVADADAEELGPVPLIGYEWTATAGHRTVLFEQPAPCAARRLPGQVAAEQYRVADAPDSDRFLPSAASPRRTPAALWAGLDAGADQCKEAGRVVTIPLHPAAAGVGAVDWADPENTANLRYERLVEIVSEHGVAECVDLAAEGCGFGVSSSSYDPDGSVQAALLQGRRLGFVGGTDSHDGRPGSIEDGPSCTAELLEDGSLRCRSFSGGLAGVYYLGDLDRRRLFDGLMARNTLATTGPRPQVAAALVSRAGEVFLPGDDVPLEEEEGAAAFSLLVSVPGHPPEEVTAIELLRADGSVDGGWGTPRVSDRVLAEAGEVRYLRVRLEIDGREERLWLSPFFFRGPE